MREEKFRELFQATLHGNVVAMRELVFDHDLTEKRREEIHSAAANESESSWARLLNCKYRLEREKFTLTKEETKEHKSLLFGLGYTKNNSEALRLLAKMEPDKVKKEDYIRSAIGKGNISAHLDILIYLLNNRKDVLINEILSVRKAMLEKTFDWHEYEIVRNSLEKWWLPDSFLQYHFDLIWDNFPDYSIPMNVKFMLMDELNTPEVQVQEFWRIINHWVETNEKGFNIEKLLTLLDLIKPTMSAYPLALQLKADTLYNHLETDTPNKEVLDGDEILNSISVILNCSIEVINIHRQNLQQEYEQINNPNADKAKAIAVHLKKIDQVLNHKGAMTTLDFDCTPKLDEASLPIDNLLLIYVERRKKLDVFIEKLRAFLIAELAIVDSIKPKGILTFWTQNQFADIRYYLRDISQSTPPLQVVFIANEYLQELTNAQQSNRLCFFGEALERCRRLQYTAPPRNTY